MRPIGPATINAFTKTLLAPVVPLTPQDVAVLDRNAQALGVPQDALMERAGHAVSDLVQQRYPDGSVLVLVGGGNNGGDGAVAARFLAQAGRDVHILLVTKNDTMGTKIADTALRSARDAGVPVAMHHERDVREEVAKAGVVVDALLGVGVHGALREPVRRVVEQASDGDGPVVAVDLPSGHDADLVLTANVTVTLHDRKVGMKEEACGEVVVADIGIPEQAVTHVGPGDLEVRYPRTPDDSRKGKMGKLLVVAGGPYTGAPVLAGMGAFATGTDLVHMALPENVAPTAQEVLLEAIVHPLVGKRLARAHGPLVEEYMDDAHVLLLGPGLGRISDTLATVRDLVKYAKRKGKRGVFDADVFSAYEEDDPAPLKSEGFVLTPHAGEFKKISGIDLPEDTPGRLKQVRDWLGDADTVVLLKGPEDLIVTKDRYQVNTAHDPVMTTGGTGDVLTGIVAALLGRGMEPFHAAAVGAYLNGCAGIEARRRLDHGVRARDVARQVPYVLKKHLDSS